MADKLDNAAATALDKIVSATDAMVAKLATLADKYGPEVIDSALLVVRLDGVKTILMGIVFAALAGAGAFAWRRLFRAYRPVAAAWSQYWASHTPRPKESDDPYIFGLIGLAVASVVCAIAAVVHLLDFWAYVAIAEPKLWVAKRLLGL
jgi:hypothetical protein